MNPTLIAVPIMAGLSIFLVIFGLSRRGGNADLEKRLDQYATREVEMMEQRKKGKGGDDAGITGRLNRALTARGASGDVATQLAQADLKIKVSEYMLLNVASVLVAFLIGYVLFRSLFLAIAAAVFGYFAPRMYVAQRTRQRLHAFSDQLSDAINLLANSLRSGYSLLQSMETVSNELGPPLATEFGRVVQEIALGLSTEQALANMLRRIESDDLDMLVTAINVQHEVGGNLAEILETIGHTIRERVRIKGEIRVLTAQQMITAYLISFLPVGLGMILYVINSDYIGLLFSEPCGWIMVTIAATIIIVGFVIIRKIVDIEV
jgi:tight adherence protein B